MNHLTRFRKITILRFVLAGLVLLFSVPALFADGIASRYPNDVGIENDPDVILFDGFESYTSPSQLRPKWDQAGPQGQVTTDFAFGGHYPGLGRRPPPDGTGFSLFTLQNHKGETGRGGEVQPGYAQVTF
jgi:hypothetical protein